ncbi:uncharacterized protein [Mytilus edulis]|uniref:uncharacterized protein n=1 Tax=Mytilus edulis TaxID=6550 RepID=UPI0039EF107E
MATVTSTNCTVCESQSIINTAVKWCFECDEAFCPDCLKYHSNVKLTKSHAVVDVSDLKELPEFVLKIKQHCEDHGALFQNYCLSHERPCCRICINSTHKNCTDLPTLEDVTKNARNSIALEDIKERLLNLKKYYECLCLEKQSNAKEIQAQSITIIEHVKSTRLKLNQHLDRLEREVLKKVSDLETNALQDLERISRDLKDKEDILDDLNKSIIKMQNHASELQILLGTKALEFEISTREKEIEGLTKDNSLNVRSIDFKENIKLSAFTTDVFSFGDTAMEMKPSKNSYTMPKEKQAQMSIEGRKFDDIRLKLINEFNFRVAMYGCATLKNDIVCYTAYNTKTVYVKNTNGVLLHSIVLPEYPYDVVFVNDQALAVTAEGKILIVSLKTRSVAKTIEASLDCHGISISDKNLICNSAKEGLLSINLDNDILTKLDIGSKTTDSYVAMHDGKVYCTNTARPSIQCYNVDKTLAWEFMDKSLIRPRGIAVDKTGVVYVGNEGGGNIIVISPDGGNHKAIKIDSIPNPRTLSFNKARTRLLICSFKGEAGIFDFT